MAQAGVQKACTVGIGQIIFRRKNWDSDKTKLFCLVSWTIWPICPMSRPYCIWFQVQKTCCHILWDKSSFVGKIEISGYAKLFILSDQSDNLSKLILCVGHIVYCSRFSKHVVIKEHLEILWKSLEKNQISTILTHFL